MRILQLTLSFHPGGRREAIATLATALRRDGVRCELACIEALGCPDEKLAESFDAWSVLTPEDGGRREASRELKRLCLDRQIDVIHCHGAASQFLAARAFWWSKSPRIVMTFHRSLNQDTARFRDRVRNSLAALRCSAIVVGSRERWRYYTSANLISRKKVIRIPFGVDTHRFRADPVAREAIRQELGIEPGQILVGMMGHFGPEKGIDVGMAAFGQCLQRSPKKDLRMIVLGTGKPERLAMLQTLAGQSGARVQFVGFQSVRERYFAAMDLFLHTPRLEAFGLVVAEAMSAGLPIVATDVGGVPDLVRPEETGVLAPSEGVAPLAAALERLVGDAELRARFGNRGHEVAESEYSAEVYAKRHSDLYRTVLAGSPIEQMAEFQGPVLEQVHEG